jgi:hypothetical protein
MMERWNWRGLKYNGNKTGRQLSQIGGNKGRFCWIPEVNNKLYHLIRTNASNFVIYAYVRVCVTDSSYITVTSLSVLLLLLFHDIKRFRNQKWKRNMLLCIISPNPASISFTLMALLWVHSCMVLHVDHFWSFVQTVALAKHFEQCSTLLTGQLAKTPTFKKWWRRCLTLIQSQGMCEAISDVCLHLSPSTSLDACP